MSHHLNLAEEFPQFRSKIHDLKIGDAHFSRILGRYDDLCEAIHRAEQRLDALSEETEETMRKERLSLKDELYAMLTK